jgi:hypothetical protein
MSDQRSSEPKQKTRPRGKDSSGRPAKPVEIPLPNRKQVEKFMRDVVGDRKPERESST